ncbi:MAG: hypothetical protein ABSC94_12875 [Polyangiaceae bacterium]
MLTSTSARIRCCVKGGGPPYFSTMSVLAHSALALLLPSCQATPPAATRPSDAQFDWLAWQKDMMGRTSPEKGCFSATPPSPVWQSVACETTSSHPLIPAKGPQPATIGNGIDNALETTTLVSEAQGSFLDAVVGPTSEENVLGDASTGKDSFSLQLNSNRFTTSACDNSPQKEKCQGWQQFELQNDGVQTASITVQYWLIDYGRPCPTDWHEFGDEPDAGITGSDCFVNGPRYQIPGAPLSIADIGHFHLAGSVSRGLDWVFFWQNDGPLYAQSGRSLLNLALEWHGAEFNVVGLQDGSRANFGAGTTITVQLNLGSSVGGVTGSCADAGFTGFTGETNSLDLLRPCCPVQAGILFTESNVADAKSPCECPTGLTWNPDPARCELLSAPFPGGGLER